MLKRSSSSFAGLLALFSAFVLNAQDRLPRAIDPASTRVTLAGSIPMRARQATDTGAVANDRKLDQVSLRFSMTAAQTRALDQLLLDQQNPGSPRYHQWLTPEQFGARFGLSTADLSTISDWLQAQGLTVTGIARSHTFITFSGSAGAVEQALGVSLHTFAEAGQQHFSNLSDPVLPAQLAGVVSVVTGLNDFHLRPRTHSRVVPAPKPEFTSSVSGNHFIAPGDFNTLYDINPLITGSINGSGVTIAVLGQTDILLSDVSAFRAASGLSATNLPTVKLYGADPGFSTNDIDEAQLDVEWSGAIAPSASILYVNSKDVLGTSMVQTIDNKLAPIITVSYGNCETGFGAANLISFNALFQQANAQGQTIVGPTGDAGATDCDYQVTTATQGLAVDYPGSSPSVTAVGGTMFNEGSVNYWSASNNSNAGSALSYIPEQPWNESYLLSQTGTLQGLASGGGGVSAFFSKPAWQIGTGVPSDFSRDTPDLSFNAAASHDGYLFCSQGFCTNGFRDAAGNLDIVGGTSVSTPSFAGILALLEQKIKNSVGNANPTLYGLANSPYYASVFHDVTTGNNTSPCNPGTTGCNPGDPNFNPATASVPFANIGYNAGVGYDLASGWGSLDVFNLVSDWLLVTPSGTASTIGSSPSITALATSATNISAGTALTLTVSVTSSPAGLASPTGTVQLLVDNTPSGPGIALTGGNATLPVFSTTGLVSGNHTLSVSYSGDAVYTGSKGFVIIDIVSATLADFNLSPTSSSVSTPSGSTASGLTLTIAPVNGFTGPVTFAIGPTTTTLNANYSFTPATITISGTASQTTVLSLQAFQTNSSTHTLMRRGTAAASSHDPGAWKLAGSGLALCGLLLVVLPRRRRWTPLVAILFAAGVFSLTGCSGAAGSGQTNAAPGSYLLTVVATGTNAAGVALSHSVNVTFIVR